MEEVASDKVWIPDGDSVWRTAEVRPIPSLIDKFSFQLMFSFNSYERIFP